MSDTIQIELPLVLPDIPDAHDSCVRRLEQRLVARPGIKRVHVTRDTPPELCVHYDAEVLPLARIERLVRQTGVAIGERYGHEALHAGRFEIDFLMLVAAAGAAALGAWAEGVLLLLLFSLGHALEGYAMGRAKRAIEALGELAPKTTRVLRGEGTEQIPVEALAIDDIVVVRPNERLPADGFVVSGTSSVDQAPITGESVPVDKSPVEDADAAAGVPEALEAANRVFAGSINGNGALEIRVTRASADSTLARVVTMVSEAETNRSPTQRLTDRFERIFVPAVLVLVVLLLFAGFVIDEPFSETFYRAMAVLVAASPCALAIATPSAVLSGVARAARGGVLVKGGAPLRNLADSR